jgi:hypothetical protein
MSEFMCKIYIQMVRNSVRMWQGGEHSKKVIFGEAALSYKVRPPE